MQKMINPNGRQSFCDPRAGFTLIELMMAMLVFTVGVLAVGAMQSRSIKTSDTAKYITEDLSLAAAMLERFAGLDYNSDQLKSKDANDWDGYQTQGGQQVLKDPDFTQTFGRYTVSWEVCQDYMAKNPGDPPLPAKRIAMTIAWTAPDGQNRVRNFEFIKVQ